MIEWDSKKAGLNLKKHKVSFYEEKSIFYDESAIQFYDNDHSNDKDRFILLGMSNASRVLIVCHCEREAGEVVRIISARKATAKECTFYKGESNEK